MLLWRVVLVQSANELMWFFMCFRVFPLHQLLTQCIFPHSGNQAYIYNMFCFTNWFPFWFLTVNFNTCDGKTRVLFQSVDKRFDVNMDGTVTLKRPLTLREAYEVFSVHAWDANGKKHTVSIRVEFVQHLNGHHKDTVMNISSPQVPIISFKKLLYNITIFLDISVFLCVNLLWYFKWTHLVIDFCTC